MILLRQIQYNYSNKEKIAEQRYEHYQKNKEKLLLKQNEYRKHNKDKCILIIQRRRARERQLPDNITNDEIVQLKEHYKFCPYCGVELDNNVIIHLDHIIPIGYSSNLTEEEIEDYGEFIGSTKYNMVPCCSECNLRKSNKYLPEEIDRLQKKNKKIFS
jgi:5-methylcytosine-specific restriction endonuclease McrA